MKPFTWDEDRALIGRHRRWHVDRGKVEPSCPLCIEEIDVDAHADRSTRAQAHHQRRGREAGAALDAKQVSR